MSPFQALEALKAIPSLKYLQLDLSGNQLGKEDAEALSMFSAAPMLRGLALNLSMNRLGAGVQTLRTWRYKVNRFLVYNCLTAFSEQTYPRISWVRCRPSFAIFGSPEFGSPVCFWGFFLEGLT